MDEMKDFTVEWSLGERLAKDHCDDVIDRTVQVVAAAARRQMAEWFCEVGGHEFENVDSEILKEPISVVWFDAICRRCKATRSREKEAQLA